MENPGFSLIQRKIMDFHDFPWLLRKSGCQSHPHTPQVMCRPTQARWLRSRGPCACSSRYPSCSSRRPSAARGPAQVVLLALRMPPVEFWTASRRPSEHAPERQADLLVAAAGADRAHALLAELRHRRRAAHLELALLLVDAALACNEHRVGAAIGNSELL